MWSKGGTTALLALPTCWRAQTELEGSEAKSGQPLGARFLKGSPGSLPQAGLGAAHSAGSPSV